ncbi:conserved hypothetical protein [metagenome]|uniref:Uncharacterized protein n=1 Tax=metagenome TaxID=256318 RepID=A0A2P2BZ12_9ZZZZ
MSSAAVRSTGVRRWLVVVALLAGLLAMHGLDDHGTSGGSMPGMSGMSHSLPSMAASPATADGGAVASPTTVDGSGPMGLCVALLLAGLAFLVGLERGRWIRRYADSRLLVRSVGTRARSPDPPDLIRLGLCRC